MRKLVVIANAMLKAGEPWRETAVLSRHHRSLLVT
jgi:hypothetical protein